jgi:hypothetical protein
MHIITKQIKNERDGLFEEVIWCVALNEKKKKKKTAESNKSGLTRHQVCPTPREKG